VKGNLLNDTINSQGNMAYKIATHQNKKSTIRTKPRVLFYTQFAS